MNVEKTILYKIYANKIQEKWCFRYFINVELQTVPCKESNAEIGSKTWVK